MSLTRFQQLKRFFHVSNPYAHPEPWYFKLEPISTKLQETFHKFYTPSTNVSVDEMMVQFSGRGMHTVRIKNKPAPQGYKVLSLCDAGDTYSFLYTSRVHPFNGIEEVPGLSKTSSVVYQLVKTPPYRNLSYNVPMDNYSSNISLFISLRGLKIGACGTVRSSSSRFSKELRVNKGDKLDWNTLSGVVVDDKVIAILWMDNGPVTMLSTIHEIMGDASFVMRNRRHPRETSTNGRTVRAVFQGHPRAALKIPMIITIA